MDVVDGPTAEEGPPAAPEPVKRRIPDDVQQLFRCRQTVFSMLRKRGYVAPATPDVLHVGKFADKFGLQVERSELLLSVQHSEDPNRKLHVVRCRFDITLLVG